MTPNFEDSNKLQQDLINRYTNNGTLSASGQIKKDLAEKQYKQSLIDSNADSSSNRATSQALSNLFGGDALSTQNINDQADQGLYNSQASLQNLNTLMNTGIDQEDAMIRQKQEYDLMSNILPQMRMADDDRINRIKLANAEANAKSNASKSGLFSSLLGVGGALAGNAVGGPAGAMIGSSLGSGIAGSIY